MNITKLCLFIVLLSLVAFTQADAAPVYATGFGDATVFTGSHEIAPVGEAGDVDAITDAWNEKIVNPNTGWAVVDLAVDFPETGREGFALWNAVDGCISSGVTGSPYGGDFVDGIIDMQMSWQDDDSVGFTFRQQPGEEYNFGEIWGRHHPEVWGTGYQVVFGYNETVAVQLNDVGEGCAVDGTCLNNDPLDPFGRGIDLNGDGEVRGAEEDSHVCDVSSGADPPEVDLRVLEHTLLADHGFEVGGVPAIEGNAGRGAMPQENKHVLFGRARVEGNNIQIWYGPVEFVNPQSIADGLAESGPNSIYLNITNDLYSGGGSVGLWTESWGNGIIDNFIINNDPDDTLHLGMDTAVGARDKLATQWGDIKSK